MVQLIAELCQNHCGDRMLLGEMIAAAAESGADIVKSQIIFSEDLTHRTRFDEGEVHSDGTRTAIKRPYQSEYDRLKTLDLTEDDHRFFIAECLRHHVLPMTTVFSRRRIPFAASLAWPKRIVKVASYDCASLPMLRELAEHFDHLYISTGATHDHEILRTADTLAKAGKSFSFLHCVTSYPNTMDMCNLRRMLWLKRCTPSVGWSDHTLVERDGLKASKAAIALGAEVIERHFTILEKDQTKDGPVSITPKMLHELANFTKLDTTTQLKEAKSDVGNWEEILGTETRPLSPKELLNRDYYRGRFASRVHGTWINNWEEEKVS